MSFELIELRNKHRQFYFAVYPEFDAVKDHFYCGGGLDLGLNEQGLEDAKKFVRRFQKNPLKIRKIFSSPELRSVQFADCFHDLLRGKVQLLRSLSDQNLGILEGEPFRNKESNGLILESPQSGEFKKIFVERVQAGLKTVLLEESLSLLVTHERVIQVLFDMLNFEKSSIERCKLYSVDLPLSQGKPHLREV